MKFIIESNGDFLIDEGVNPGDTVDGDIIIHREVIGSDEEDLIVLDFSIGAVSLSLTEAKKMSEVLSALHGKTPDKISIY